MKNYRRLVFALLSSFTLSTFAGHATGNGGDEYALSFVKTANDVVHMLPSKISPQMPVTAQMLDETIQTTSVESTNEELALNGAPKDAINYPTLKKIVFNRQAWDRIVTSSTRHALVFHEYLGIMGIDDSHYQISSVLMSASNGEQSYNKCSELPEAQQAVFSAFNNYLASGTDQDAMMYIGVLGQYLVDVDQFADKSNPDYGNLYTVAIYESVPSYLCTDVAKFEKKVEAGNTTAIKLLLFYSAISKGDDGAAAEELGELQDKARKQYPKVVQTILQQNSNFFAKHPMVWMNDNYVSKADCLANGGRANDGADGVHLICQGGLYDGAIIQ